ncbi:MAG: UvrD-helicase domain-containing protein [Nitrospirae bacterium]|nr:UvrD-helicase domain-containing protein [Nitrospirota bacterium]
MDHRAPQGALSGPSVNRLERGDRGARPVDGSALSSGLNPEQARAVAHGDGPLLILAGAGSGKTRVLTHRIAHLIATGRATPADILAVTFTNKAARELRERLAATMGERVSALWVGTFHAICLRLLRLHGTADGARDFGVLDAGQARQAVARVAQGLNINSELYPHAAIAARISRLKNDLIDADACSARAEPFGMEARVAQVYPAYEAHKRARGVRDFDDLLVETHRLLATRPELAQALGERFRYLFVDEFQDTNVAQFAILKVLARPHGNLCVVGDDDQSIYAFRGANVGNILSFTDSFPGAATITLGCNYRSTGHILKAAGAVIAGNTGRHAKALWTGNPDGAKPAHHLAADETAEMRHVVSLLRRERDAGRAWAHMAVLFRANSQARVLEEGLSADRVPYRVVGGMRFYQRKEVRDLMAYLRLAVGAGDDDAALRVLNSPPRGIGDANRARIEDFARTHALSIIDALARMVAEKALTGVALKGAGELLTALGKLRAGSGSAAELLQRAVDATGYHAQGVAESFHEALARREVVAELIGAAQAHGGDPLRFLDDQALAGDMGDDAGGDQVSLMTLHAAKGLEFPVVIMVGMEEGVFPHSRALDDPAAMDEERRLCYVGMTRARERLYLVSAQSRRLFGDPRRNLVSRFVGAIPAEHLECTSDRPAPEALPRPQGFARRQEADPRNAAIRKHAPLAPRADARAGSYAPGAQVRHATFGLGQVKCTEGSGDGERVVVAFPGVGLKKLAVKQANLEVIS